MLVHRLSSHAGPATLSARRSGEISSAEIVPAEIASAEKSWEWRAWQSSSSAAHSTCAARAAR